MRKPVRAILLVVALAAATIAATGTAASAAGRDLIAGSHPNWASDPNRVAAADAAGKITFRVYLKLRNEAGAQRTARDVSTPGSAGYGRFLSTDQVRARYAPTASSVDTVRSWLDGAGFTVGEVPDNNLFVESTGSVAQAQQAFGVGLNLYRVDGQVLRAADRELSVPRSVSALVSGVIGVDSALSLLRPSTTGAGREAAPGVAAADPTGGAPAAGTAGGTPAGGSTVGGGTMAGPAVVAPPAGFRNARPCGAYWAQQTDTTDPALAGEPNPLPYAPCGYQPGQLRAAYGLTPYAEGGLDGRGATVAIVDAFASPTLYQDAARYAERNDPAHPLTTDLYSQLVFPANPELEPADQCNAAGWYGEQTLDVEAVHAMAPGAHILFVGGSDCQDLSLDKALNAVVANNLAQLVSNSYGSAGEEVPADEVQAFGSIALQAVLEGIGVYFSSGDSGDESANLDTPSPDFAASSPWVTAVGGTSLGIGQDGRKVVESGWETGRSVLTAGVWTPGAPGEYLYGSGGGTSQLFAQPDYQRGVVSDTLARANQTGQTRGRVVPDISMLGDPNTGMLIGETQTFPDGVRYDEFRIGGTSLSAPLLAGYVAVADQVRGRRHGFINPALYQLGSNSSAITDVQHADAAVVRVDYVNGVDASGGLRTSARTFDYPNLTIHTAPGYDDVTGLGTPNGAALLLQL